MDVELLKQARSKSDAALARALEAETSANSPLLISASNIAFNILANAIILPKAVRSALVRRRVLLKLLASPKVALARKRTAIVKEPGIVRFLAKAFLGNNGQGP